MNANFLKYVQRNGAYSQHWLVKITGHGSDGSEDSLFFVNNNEDINYQNDTYLQSAFDFNPSATVQGFDGGGTLEITTKDKNGIDNGIYARINGKANTSLEVTGVLDENGRITPIKHFSMHYGTISGNREKITFDFEKDDRLEMTFPALVFNHYNNRGN